MKDLVVVGGGIAGLACAHEAMLRRPDDAIVLVEAEGRLGGNIRTSREDGFTIEWGVNGFLNSVPETLELAREVGMEGELLPSNAAAAKRYIYRGGRLRAIPLSPPAFFRSDVLSVRGRLRILAEPFAARAREADETVHRFAARRIGREAADVLVGPMVSGVYAGDARVLSLRSTFPKMHEMESAHGSLVRALIARQRQARRRQRAVRSAAAGGPAGPAGSLTSFGPGMESFVDAIARRLGDERIRRGARVTSVHKKGGEYAITVEGEDPLEARRVVVAAPARHAARFLAQLDGDLARDLDGIAYAGLAVVALAYRIEDLGGAAPDGFGFLVPRGEGLRILGCLWDSSVFCERAPHGWVLLRAMIGGAHEPAAVDMAEEEILAVVRGDLAASMGIESPPRWTRVYRHALGIPQYLVGHEDRLARIDARIAALPGLHLAGNSYRGVAVNNCVKEAKALVRSWGA